MAWLEKILDGLKRIIVMENKVTELSKDVEFLSAGYAGLSERLARIEGKFEAYERVALSGKALQKPGKREN